MRIGDLLTRPAAVISSTATVREALDTMVTQGVGRLPLVDPEHPGCVAGIVTRSDILKVYGTRLHEKRRLKRSLKLGFLSRKGAEPGLK
ncbi:MAG: CBS domain-containing protein [Acidobacteriota bacterium]